MDVTLTFVVVDQLSTPLVLGMSFLEAVNPTIDWRAKCVSWSTPTGSITLNGALWSNSGAVQLVSVESLLQAKEAGAATGFWRVDIGLPQAG